MTDLLAETHYKKRKMEERRKAILSLYQVWNFWKSWSMFNCGTHFGLVVKR
jgi:hypothetical protein